MEKSCSLKHHAVLDLSWEIVFGAELQQNHNAQKKMFTTYISYISYYHITMPVIDKNLRQWDTFWVLKPSF